MKKKKQIPTTKTVKIFKLYKMLVIIFQKNEIFKKKVASPEPYTNFSNILPIFR